MAGKRRGEEELLKEARETAARLEAKLARKARIASDAFAADCDKALKALTKVVESEAKAPDPRLIQRCSLAMQALESFLEGKDEVPAGEEMQDAGA